MHFSQRCVYIHINKEKKCKKLYKIDMSYHCTLSTN